jgi:hypothetical protein
MQPIGLGLIVSQCKVCVDGIVIVYCISATEPDLHVVTVSVKKGNLFSRRLGVSFILPFYWCAVNATLLCDWLYVQRF